MIERMFPLDKEDKQILSNRMENLKKHLNLIQTMRTSVFAVESFLDLNGFSVIIKINVGDLNLAGIICSVQD